MLTNAYLGVFNDKLKKIRVKLKELLSLPKNKRDKKRIRLLIKEAKELKSLICVVTEEGEVCVCCGQPVRKKNETKTKSDTQKIDIS